MPEEPKYDVSADVVGHLQAMQDLPEVGASVRVIGHGMDVTGQVFAHIPHPSQDGWGFALIKMT